MPSCYGSCESPMRLKLLTVLAQGKSLINVSSLYICICIFFLVFNIMVKNSLMANSLIL